MLPVATGPNAICYGASSLSTRDMMRSGLIMNVICILTTWWVAHTMWRILVWFAYFRASINSYGMPLYGLSHFPTWGGESNCTVM